MRRNISKRGAGPPMTSLLTQLEVPIAIPLIEMQIYKLEPMEMRRESDRPRHRIGRRKDPFACFQILETEDRQEQWVEAQLTKSIVRVAVERVHDELEPQLTRPVAQRAVAQRARERAGDIMSNSLILSINVHKSARRCEGILGAGGEVVSNRR